MFQTGTLLLCKDSEGKTVADNIPYKSITSVSNLNKDSFYFKTSK